MFRLIEAALPPLLHRYAYRAAHRLRVHYLRWRGGEIYGVCVIVRDDADRVLLVRHSYGRRSWSLPGGGRKADEDPAATAHREMREELGCALVGLRHLGRTEHVYHTANNVMDVFTARAGGDVRIDGREIVAAQFFARDALPQGIAASVRALLARLDHSSES